MVPAVLMLLMILAILVILTAAWAVHARRVLAAAEENCRNAMAQIGVQLSSRFDALSALADLAEAHTGGEARGLAETIRSRQCAITGESTPGQVAAQEAVIDQTLEHIARLAAQHPELAHSQSYLHCLDAVDSYEKMVRTSCLIYNDSAAGLNRRLRRFPTALAAGLLGFRQRDCLEYK